MPEKICVKCGKDVASLKRTKDQQGNYWCASCAKAEMAGRQASQQYAVEPDGAEDDLTAQLLDEAVVYQENVCPNCRSAMGKDVVICVNCGYNTQSGRQAHTKVKKESESAAKALGAASFVANSWPVAMGFALIGGAVAGGLGAGVWALVAYNLHIEHSLIAWGVAGAVGFGVVIGARGYTGILTGLMAAVIAIAAIAGGRMWAFSMIADDILAEMDFEAPVDRSEIVSYIATDVADEWEAAGEQLRWPRGQDNYTAWEQNEFPSDVWQEAQTRWSTWDEPRRQQYIAAKEAENRQTGEDLGGLSSGSDMMEVFWATLSPIDFLFFGIAIVIAAGVGSGGELSMGMGDD